jgi:hypothetical protein
MRVRPCPNQSARKLTAKSKRAEAEPPQGEVNVKTKIVKVEAPATGVTETGTAVVKARGVMPDNRWRSPMTTSFRRRAQLPKGAPHQRCGDRLAS